MQLPASVTQHLHANAEEAAQALADAVADRLRARLAQSTGASLLLSGGRTPARFQQLLSQKALDWSKVSISLADDRWLPPDHIDSNEWLLRKNLLTGPAAAARFVPLVDITCSPEQHLANAELALDTLAKPLDAIVLGVGDDGHTASLFPDAMETLAAMNPDNARRLAIIRPASAPYTRISATLRTLLDARIIYILVQGDSKRAALEAACRSGCKPLAIAAILHQLDVPVHLYFSP